MIPVAYVEHQLPGRVRLRVPSRRGEVPFFEKVVRELSKHPAVRELNATPLTGSITLQYAEPLRPITAAAADQGLFETSRSEPTLKTRPSTQQAGTRPSKQQASDHPTRASGLAAGLATGLSGLCIFQFVQGNVLGSAVENFWLSFGAHRTLGRPDIATAFAGLGVYQMLRGQLFGSASSLMFYALVLQQIAAMEEAQARGWAGIRTAKSATNGPGKRPNSGTAVDAPGSHLRQEVSELSS